MVRPAWPETDTRAVVQPQLASLGLFNGNPEPLTLPDAPNALEVHMPTFSLKQGSNPAIAITAILRRQADDGLSQSVLVIQDYGLASLRRAMLTKNPTGAPF